MTKLLLIDDDEIDRQAIRRALAKTNLKPEIVEAENAEQGLKILSEQEFDCILLDFRLPDKDGLDILIELHEGGQEVSVPVVMLTGLSYDELVLKTLQAGAQDFLSKETLTPDLLSRAIINAMERQELMLSRIRAEKVLHAKETELRAVLDHAPDSILSIRHDGKIVSINKAGELMFGYKVQDIYKQEISVLIPPGTNGNEHATINKLIEAGDEGRKDQVIQELVGKKKDGTTFPVEVSLGPMAGEDGGFIVVIRDISQRRDVEERFRQAQKMEAVGQLTGGVAHDFNNLLTAVIGGLRLLEGEKLSNSAKDCVELALSSAVRGAELTKRLLAFSRRQALEAKAYEASELVRDMETLIKRSIGAEVKFEIHTPDKLLSVLVDRNEFENVLLNLSINARDAMPSGGTLSIEVSEVEIGEKRAERDEMNPGKYVLTTVSDTGLGMTEEVKKKALEPFFTTKGVGKGTGLGLSQVFGFVKQSGGHMTIYSELGHGTSIKLYLPLIEGASEIEAIEEKAVELLKDPETRKHLKGKKILLVDDDPGVRMFAEKVLSASNYRVTTADDGASALEAIKNGKNFDLLIADMVMPDDITGADIAEAFRKKFPGSGILFCSGYPEKVLRTNGRLAVTGEVLPKPYDLTALLTKVEQLLVMTEIDQQRRSGGGAAKQPK